MSVLPSYMKKTQLLYIKVFSGAITAISLSSITIKLPNFISLTQKRDNNTFAHV